MPVAADSFDVAVLGLGALGSSAAYHLARRGARVVGLDRYRPPHALGSSHGATRIIREAYFEHPLYVPLVQRAAALWRDLARESGRDLLLPTGGLMIGPRAGQLVRGALASARQHRLVHELLSAAEVRRRFPAFAAADDEVAVWEPRAGILFPEACVESHLALAERRGAVLRYDEAVTSWRADGAGVRLITARGEIVAERLLVAAGSWTGGLFPDLALPLAVARQTLFWFAPRRPSESLAPSRFPVFLWETAPERIAYGFPDLGDGIKVAIHHEGEPADPDRVEREVSEAEVEAIRARLDHRLPDALGSLARSAVCLYTNTPDGHFWIDRHPVHPQVTIASACSGHGFKFVSALGEALAEELLDGGSRLDLSPFRRR